MILTVEVKPNARETKILGWKDAGTVRIAIAAPAQDGKANKALIEFLAKEYKLAKSLIEIVRGHTGRVKHVRIPDNIKI